MGKIIELSNSDFDGSGNLVDTSISGLVLFQADWCGHCKKLKPVWEEVSKNHDVYKVDCTDRSLHSNLVQLIGVKGFPTIYVFQKGIRQGEYSGPRTADAINNYISTHFKKVRFEEPPSANSVMTADTADSAVAPDQGSCDNGILIAIVMSCAVVILLIIFAQRRKTL